MGSNKLERITYELDTKGFSVSSYDDLGLVFDSELVEKLCQASASASFSPAAAELTKHIEKQKMTMVQDESALAFGRLLVGPVVETLFAHSPRALKGWSLYAMNRYEAGGKLGSHQDSVGSTVLVATVSGVRKFDVYKRGQAAIAGQIEESFLLSPGSIMLLDGQADPEHSVECIEGPSLSAVFDVPDLLRP